MRNTIVAIGIGSNLENPLRHLRNGLALLKSNFEVKRVSSIYESDALVPAGAPSTWNNQFLNACVLIEIPGSIGAIDLLNTLKKFEEKMGRIASEKWSPRKIDFDILAWGADDFFNDALQIPHSELFKRPFALLPLMEVWPEYKIGKTLPTWARGWIETRPLNTIKSKRYFWPQFMGILNVTDDSFSDGGRYLDKESIQQKASELIRDGAEIIDIGAESTRPGAKSVAPELELQKLKLALNSLVEIDSQVKISIDSRRPEVVGKLLEESGNFDFINDVTGLESLQMRSLVKSSGLKAFVMHSLTVPADPKVTLSDDLDPIESITSWWSNKEKLFAEEGVMMESLVLDFGIGFGKTRSQNLYLLQNIERLAAVHDSILVGHSRKSFMQSFTESLPDDRDLETAIISQSLPVGFVEYLRVHNVAAQKRAMATGSYFGKQI